MRVVQSFWASRYLFFQEIETNESAGLTVTDYSLPFLLENELINIEVELTENKISGRSAQSTPEWRRKRAISTNQSTVFLLISTNKRAPLGLT